MRTRTVFSRADRARRAHESGVNRLPPPCAPLSSGNNRPVMSTQRIQVKPYTRADGKRVAGYTRASGERRQDAVWLIDFSRILKRARKS